MRLGILTSGRAKSFDEPGALPPLVEAGQKRGHEVILIHEPELVIAENGDGRTITHLGQPLPQFDVILNRPGFVTEPSLHSVTTSALAAAGFKIINHSKLGDVSKNKLAQHLILSQAGLPLPRWAIARRPIHAVAAGKMIGFPLMIKVAFGTHGKGVFLAENVETLSPIVDYLTIRDGNPVIIEEFIAEAEHKDLRAFVIGDAVVAAMERVARDGDVRANASLGGVGRPVELTDEEKQVAVKATKAFDLDIAGVDLLRSKRGPLLIEVNANPGFEELTRTTGIDVAGAIIDYLEKQ